MIDSHCHLTYDGLHERVDEVIAAATSGGVDRMITIGTSPDDAQKAVALTRRFTNVYAAVGLHPHYSAACPDRETVMQSLRQLASQPGVVALGEMGLDRHYPEPPLESQRKSFEWQLELMHEFPHLPGIIHNREATLEVIQMIRASGIPGGRFDFHCFTGDGQELDAILDLGAMVGFTGIITFKNAAKLADLAVNVPLERLLIETDSPYLTPEPHRKVKTNEPRYVADVARFLAARRSLSMEELTAVTDANATRLFHLPN